MFISGGKMGEGIGWYVTWLGGADFGPSGGVRCAGRDGWTGLAGWMDGWVGVD
jgi:hypothetical protein